MSQVQADYMQIYRAMTTPRLISEAWDNREVVDPKLRDRIVTVMMERERKGEGAAVWPSAAVAAREEMAGLYPDPADPQFAARLFSKREFYEARAVAAGVAEGDIDPCTSAAAEKVFELTPVQRVVSRFLHPLTPYRGMLLFHGVGVGKTCSAVTIAEQFLESAPNMNVIVLVPQALKENFKKTVIDPDKLRWSPEDKQWKTRQCTGTSYLERLGLLENPDMKTVRYKLEESRRLRYTVTGYQAFANWIEKTMRKMIPAGLVDPVQRREAENEILRRLFSDRLIIIDEAHNLRDVGSDEEEAAPAPAATESPAGGADAAENAGGKALNPYLKRIVLHAEGLRLVLMTATPMYNAPQEVLLLLNYLAMNDTKSEKSALRVTDIFEKDGTLRPGTPQTMVERLARRYVSYMRGENPYTFPLRMNPPDVAPNTVAIWPNTSASKRPVVFEDSEAAATNGLPLVFTEPVPGSMPDLLTRDAMRRSAAAAAATEEGEGEGSKKERDMMLDLRMQIGNISYPDSTFGATGLSNYFTRETVTGGPNRLRVYAPRMQEDGPFNVDSVFSGEQLRLHAPKMHRALESIKTAQGISFVYSRYINAGAIPFAIALERAGFQRRMATGAMAPLLINAPPVAPICAICGKPNGPGHDAGGPEPHPFRPACYVLLTSDEELSPRFKDLVDQAATWEDDPEWGPLGGKIKVVVGSQVASEGLDLKCIREMHILDAWYHLNRTEQIIGRAIRYCSHTALRAVERRRGLPPMAMNNCLIYLHALRLPDLETADMYAYRIAIGKALTIGGIQRLLKKHAWDCNLELEAITFTGLPLRRQVDSQGRDVDSPGRDKYEEGAAERYSINDRDFTTYCDYQACAHQCAVTIARTPEAGLKLDPSTFSVTDARRLILTKQVFVRRLFEDQIMVPETVVQDIFSDLPWEIASEALMELIDGRRFRLKRPDGVEGFLVKKAGYLVFQPALVTDTDIPIALRYSRAFQLRRRLMPPAVPVFAEDLPTMGAVVSAGPPRAATAPQLQTQPGVVEAVEPVAAVIGPTKQTVAGAGPVVMSHAAESGAVLERWAEWVSFLEGGELPGKMGAAARLWVWLRDRYVATIPVFREVALRWWFDKTLTYPEQRAALEIATAYEGTDPVLSALRQTLRGDIFRSKQIIAYRAFNPETVTMEHYCRPTAAGVFTPCQSNIAQLVDKALGNKPVAIQEETGTLLGFLAAKTGRIVFKTLDTTKPITHSTTGAECGNVSNLDEHRPRVRLLQEAARSDPSLIELMLPDDKESHQEAERRKREGKARETPQEAELRKQQEKEKKENMQITHLYDLTHQPLCLYLEFLSRLLDAQKIDGRRWFLSGMEAQMAGLKGKKSAAGK